MKYTPTILESPYAGDIEKNTKYARLCMHDMIVNHKEAPFASHLLYTQPNVLKDEVPEERTMGIEAGFAFREICENTVFYTDLGWSSGMKKGLENAQALTKKYEIRELPKNLL